MKTVRLQETPHFCYNLEINTHTTLPRLRLPFLVLTGALGLTVAITASAAPVQLTAKPGSLDSLLEELKPDGPVQTELSAAMCGGWNTEETLHYRGPAVLSKISKVDGAPGRQSDALGMVTAGLGKRIETGGLKNDGYQFPETTSGYATACRPNMPRTVERVQHFTGIVVPPVEYPQIADPVCGNYSDKQGVPMTLTTCAQAHDYMNEQRFMWVDCFIPKIDPASGVIIGCAQEKRRWVCSDEWEDEPGMARNSEECHGAACRCPNGGADTCKVAVNRNAYWSYHRRYLIQSEREKLAELPNDLLADNGPKVVIECQDEQDALAKARQDLATAQAAYDALDALYGDDIRHFEELAQRLGAIQRAIVYVRGILANPGAYIPDWGKTADEVRANAEQTLRFLFDLYLQTLNEMIEIADDYYAHLAELKDAARAVANAEKAVDAAADALYACMGQNALKLPTACYGFYNEFDPKLQRTWSADKRCVVNFPFTKDQLRTSQKGRGPSQTKETDLQRESRNAGFDDTQDLWYPNLGSAFSLLSEKAFQTQLGGDLTQALLRPDSARQKVSFQTATQTVAPSGRLRAFDDTVATNADATLDRKDARSVVQWWQRFQTDSERLMSGPRIRLKLPDTWALGTGDLPVEESALLVRDPRTQSIDVQLRAADDLLGQVAAFLQRSLLLKVQEEPIPVVVPLGSPLEFRSMAEQWEGWSEERRLRGKTVPPEVTALIQKLETYAVQIERVRLLRSDLAQSVGGIIDRQEAILKTIGSWTERTLTTYRAYLAERQSRQTLIPFYQLLERSMVYATEGDTVPWCRNERFTTPIYSLLDPWFPRDPQGTTSGLNGGAPSCGSTGGLPLLCPPLEDRDLVFDFSHLILTSRTVRLPVIEPVQIRLALPTPGSPDRDLTGDERQKLLLPDLPPVPRIGTGILAKLPPVVALSSGAVIPPPVHVDVSPRGQPMQALTRAFWILSEMYATTREFWKSVEPDDASRSYTCPQWGVDHCVQVEMDLLERIQRITARPEILLQEDLASIGTARGRTQPLETIVVTCNPADHACITLKPERTEPTDGWQVIPPRNAAASTDDQIQALKMQMREATIANDYTITGDTPYGATPETLLPLFSVPDPTVLTPPPPKQ